MKKLNYLILLGLSVAFFTFSGCGDDDVQLDPYERVKERLAGTWVIDESGSTSMVVFGGTENRTDAYSGFALTITANAVGDAGGNYTTTTIEEPDPWPSSGTYEIVEPDNITDPNAQTFTVERGDGLLIDVLLTETKLELTFTYDEAAHDQDDNRIKAVDGEWKFVLVPQQ